MIDKTRADIFSNYNEDQGGRLDIEMIDEYFEFQYLNLINHMEEIVKILSKSKKCSSFFNNLYCDYVFNEKPNAFSRKIDSKYFIGINSGLVHYIFNVFYMMLSHPEVLPDIGDPSLEKLDKENFQFGFDIKHYLIKKSENKYLFKFHKGFPKSKPRIIIAEILSQLALEFIFYHELGHLLKGHLEYILSLSNDTILMELNSEKDKLKIEPEILQCLEYEADGFAIFLALSTKSMIRFFTSRETIEIFKLHPKEMGYYCWFFAVSLVMRTFSQHGMAISRFKLKDHPHPQLRIIGNWWSVLLSKSVNKDKDKERILDLTAKASYDLERYWKMLEIPGHKFDPIFTDFPANFDEIGKTLVRASSKMKDIDIISGPSSKKTYLSMILKDNILTDYGLADNIDEIKSQLIKQYKDPIIKK